MDGLDKAYRYAAYYTARRMYTCREIYDKLRRKGYDSEVSEAVVGRMSEEGILDDKRYAEWYITDAVNLNAKGEYRVRQELMRKGIASSVIEFAFEDTDVDETDALREYLRPRIEMGETMTYNEYQKLRARLARRGFSLARIGECLDELELNIIKENEF